MGKTYDSGWDRERINVDSWKLAVRGRESLGLITKLGVTVPADNRLARAVVRLELAQARVERKEPYVHREDLLEQRYLAEAWRLVWDCLLVLSARLSRRRSAAAITNEHLESFLRGADLPEQDANPRPRSLQYEAYAAARLVHGGVSVWRDEPDFRFLMRSEDLGLAVKRLSSVSATTLTGKLRRAIAQLKQENLRGYVALSLDNWIEDLGESDDVTVVGARFNEQLSAAHESLDDQSEKPWLLGAFLDVNWRRWVYTEGQLHPFLEFMAPYQTLTFADDPDEIARTREYFAPLLERYRRSIQEVGKLVS